MIKKISILILVALIYCTLVNASSFNINFARNNYSPYETVQASITTDVVLSRELQNSDFKLETKDGNQIPIALKKIKINNTHYEIYFDMPQINSGDYNFGIYNIFYNDAGISRKGTFTSSLIVTNNTGGIVAVSPGNYYNILTEFEESPFTILVKNNGQDTLTFALTTDSNFLDIKTKNFSLLPKANKVINVGTIIYNKQGDKFMGIITINYGTNSYNIPVTIIRPTGNFQNLKNTTTNINPYLINITFGNAYTVPMDNITLNLESRETATLDLTLINKAQNTISNVTLEMQSRNSIIEPTPIFISSIAAKNYYPILLDINKDANFTKNVSDTLLVHIKDKTFKLPITITLKTKPENKANIIIENTTTLLSTIPPIFTPPVKKTNYLYPVFAILILIFLGVIFYLYKKSKPKQEGFGAFIENIKSKK